MISEIPKRDFHLDKKQGILVLVTCDYEGTLPGTNIDAKEMVDTFTQFDYEIVQFKNEEATKRAITFVLKQISQYLSQYNGTTKIVFAFSGHGATSDRIITHDMQRLSVNGDIFPPFIEHPGVYYIQKNFFIDACRGGSELRSKSPEQDTITKQVVHYEKGLKHREGNFFIDYATIPDHVAYDNKWMHLLAKEIRDSNESLQNIAAKVRNEVGERQQGETVDRLKGGPFYFKRH